MLTTVHELDRRFGAAWITLGLDMFVGTDTYAVKVRRKFGAFK
jgi:hypothetical protein